MEDMRQTDDRIRSTGSDGLPEVAHRRALASCHFHAVQKHFKSGKGFTSTPGLV